MGNLPAIFIVSVRGTLTFPVEASSPDAALATWAAVGIAVSCHAPPAGRRGGETGSGHGDRGRGAGIGRIGGIDFGNSEVNLQAEEDNGHSENRRYVNPMYERPRNGLIFGGKTWKPSDALSDASGFDRAKFHAGRLAQYR